MKALNGQSTGTVLWYSERDGNGIIVDDNRNEIYFDKSTWLGTQLPKRKQLLKFDVVRVSGVLCAKRVSDLLG